MASERRPHVERFNGGFAFYDSWQGRRRWVGEARFAYQTIALNLMMAKRHDYMLVGARVFKRLARFLAFVDRRAAEREQG